MNRQLLHRFAVGLLLLASGFASKPEGSASQEHSRACDLRKRSSRAIALGKAVFWNMRVGSDGIHACASCHFSAGADPRTIKQANPGGANNPDLTVNVGINHQLSAADFPLHKLADPTSRTSQIFRDNDDVICSQGVKLSRFRASGAGRRQGRHRPHSLIGRGFTRGGVSGFERRSRE